MSVRFFMKYRFWHLTTDFNFSLTNQLISQFLRSETLNKILGHATLQFTSYIGAKSNFSKGRSAAFRVAWNWKSHISQPIRAGKICQNYKIQKFNPWDVELGQTVSKKSKNLTIYACKRVLSKRRRVQDWR